MSFNFIKAKLQCDGCGKPFEVELDDFAEPVPNGWSLSQLVEDRAIIPFGYGGSQVYPWDSASEPSLHARIRR